LYLYKYGLSKNGINNAPTLNKADVSVVMDITGTEVSKGAEV
jgi:magnesium-transporting ATPase (P-type)